MTEQRILLENSVSNWINVQLLSVVRVCRHSEILKSAAAEHESGFLYKGDVNLLLDDWVSLVDPGPVPMISSSNSTEGEILTVGSEYTPKMVKCLRNS